MSQLPSSSRNSSNGTPHLRERIIGISEMATLVRAYDWGSTSLGPVESWSDTLLAMVNLVLISPISTVIYWGPEMVSIYNDAYTPLLDTKHPDSLGRSAREIWAEAWHIVGLQFEAVLTKGETTYREHFLIPVQKGGRLQDCYWNYQLSPVFENGHIVGIFNSCQNTTELVLMTRERDSIAEQLSQALQATTDSVLSLDREWRITYLNHPAEKILAAQGDVLGLNIWEAFPALIYEGSPYTQHYYRAMDWGVAGAFEAYYPEPLNIWVQVQTRPSPDGIVLFFAILQRRSCRKKRGVRAKSN